MFTVGYTYDFTPHMAHNGCIDGTLTLQAVSNNGGTHINSLSGTGDLASVHV